MKPLDPYVQVRGVLGVGHNRRLCILKCTKKSEKKQAGRVDFEVPKEDLRAVRDKHQASAENFLLDSQASGGGSDGNCVVYWDGWTAVTLFLQMCCATIPLSQGGIPLVALLLDTPLDSLDSVQISSAAVFVEVLQILIVLGLLRIGTGKKVLAGSFRYRWGPLGILQGAATGLTAIVSVGTILLLYQATGVGTESTAESVGQALLQSSAAIPTFNESVLAVFLAPLLEELIFRGFLLPSLLKVMSVEGAVATSSAAFALWHCSPDKALLLFASGCSYGMGYCWSGGNMVVPTVAHALYNLVVVVGNLTACTQGVHDSTYNQISSLTLSSFLLMLLITGEW